MEEEGGGGERKQKKKYTYIKQTWQYMIQSEFFKGMSVQFFMHLIKVEKNIKYQYCMLISIFNYYYF